MKQKGHEVVLDHLRYCPVMSALPMNCEKSIRAVSIGVEI
jgi:hypothetical protein